MNNRLTILGKVMSVAFVGFAIVIALAMLIRFYLPVILATLLPSAPEPDTPHSGIGVIKLPSNFGLHFVIIALSDFFNGFIGSFISGVALWILCRNSDSRAWHSFVIGLIIGVFSINLMQVLRDRPIILIQSIPYGVVVGLIGLLGYYLASRIFRRKITE